MGWLDMAVALPVRWSASGMPDAQKPLSIAPTAAERTLRTHAVTDVTPASVRADPPKQTLRRDLLRSGYVPGSEGDRLFVAAHGGVNVWDDPNLSHGENERLFRAADVRRQRQRSSTPESFTGNLSEEQVGDLANDVLTLSRLHGTTLQETLDEVEELANDYDLTPNEVVQALLDDDLLSDEVEELPSREEALGRIHRKLTERVNEQLSDLRATRARAQVGGVQEPTRAEAPRGEVKGSPGKIIPTSGKKGPGRTFRPTCRNRFQFRPLSLPVPTPH